MIARLFGLKPSPLLFYTGLTLALGLAFDAFLKRWRNKQEGAFMAWRDEA